MIECRGVGVCVPNEDFFFDKSRKFNRERTVFLFKSIASIIGCLNTKKNLYACLTPYVKINLKQITYLSIKLKIQEKFCD